MVLTRSKISLWCSNLIQRFSQRENRQLARLKCRLSRRDRSTQVKCLSFLQIIILKSISWRKRVAREWKTTNWHKVWIVLEGPSGIRNRQLWVPGLIIRRTSFAITIKTTRLKNHSLPAQRKLAQLLSRSIAVHSASVSAQTKMSIHYWYLRRVRAKKSK